MQKLETSLIKSMIPIFRIVDKMLELKPNSKPASETDVSAFLQLSLDSLALLGHSIDEVPYVAGRLKQLQAAWQGITSGSFVLNTIKGVKREFANKEEQTVTPRRY